jgi:UDP-N-acetylglucosamine:LPS N-acetylglucosamine transferase
MARTMTDRYDNPPGTRRRPRVMAVASRGGHWVQLLRLRPALADCDVTYVTTVRSYQAGVGDASFRVVTEATAATRFRLFVLAAQMIWLMISIRPQVVISTGAAPGCLAIRLGKLFGCRTLWIDSIANANTLSLSGKLVRAHADVVLSQWEHVAQSDRVQFYGAVL